LTTNTSTNTNRTKEIKLCEYLKSQNVWDCFTRKLQHNAWKEIISKYFIVFPSHSYSYSYSSWQINLSNILQTVKDRHYPAVVKEMTSMSTAFLVELVELNTYLILRSEIPQFLWVVYSSSVSNSKLQIFLRQHFLK